MDILERKGTKGLCWWNIQFQIECPIAAVPKTESANPEQQKWRT